MKNNYRPHYLLLLFWLIPLMWMYGQCPPPSVQTVTTTCGSSPTLSASGSTGIYRWYDQPTGGNLLGTGSTYTPSNLLYTSTFIYCEAVDQLPTPSCISGR